MVTDIVQTILRILGIHFKDETEDELKIRNFFENIRDMDVCRGVLAAVIDFGLGVYVYVDLMAGWVTVTSIGS